MQFTDLLTTRYSVRAYKPDAIEPEKLNTILEAVRLAPTAANRQPFKVILIPTAGKELHLQRIYGKPWFVQAPLVVAICVQPDQAWIRADGHNFAYVDAAIAMDHLTLAAADVGLGSCWVASINIHAAREVLSLPAGVEPVAFTPLGYPADQPKAKERKTLKDLVCYNRWE